MAGCLSAYQFGFVGPGGYNFALSVQMLFGLVIGGMHSLGGAILGGLFLQFFPDVTAGLGKGFSALLYGRAADRRDGGDAGRRGGRAGPPRRPGCKLRCP